MALNKVMEEGDYDEFFRQVLPRTVAMARRVTGERTSAEDAAVEALARAHRHWSRVGPLPWREAWVLRVASREALRQLPKRNLSRPALVEPDETDAVVLRAALGDALRRLPKRQRQAVQMDHDVKEEDLGHLGL